MSTGDAEDRESVYDDGPPELGAPVDPPDRKPVFGAITSRTDNRRPIVPASLRNRDQRRVLYRWAVRYGAHTAAYHVTRSPKYAAKTAVWAPVGVVRTVVRVLRWAAAEEGNWTLRQHAANRGDHEAFLKLDAARRQSATWRWPIVGVSSLVLLACLGLLLSPVTPAWLGWLVFGGTIPVFARLGRPADRPITDRVHQGVRYRKLTAEMVRAGIMACRIPAIKEPADITFPQEIHRDGPGYLAVLDLPPGVEAVEVIERKGRIASGLRVPIDQSWPEPVPGTHPGRLALWVGDEPASKMAQPSWPLLSPRAKADIFKAFPFGTDPRLRPITGGLMFRNWLVGAMPGAGKTFALRLVLLYAALDPRVDLCGYELKGTGDLNMLAPVCTEYGSGADDLTAEAALDMLRWLRRECERRGPIITKMAAAGKAPDNKITPELAGMRDLGLRPVVAFIDECQELFSHQEFGEEAGRLATAIIKLGRALGIILLLATQRPDKDSLPKSVSANAGVRFCLRVTGQIENDMILGTSMYKQGIRATQFEDGQEGWGWLVGLGKPVACKGYFVNGPMAAAVVARAVQLREAADTMPEPRERVPAYNLLDDVAAVLLPGEAKVWSETIVARLAELRPDIYGEWTAEQLAKALKPYNVSTGQVWGTDADGKGANRRGVDRADLMAAITSRREGQRTRQNPEIEID
jgi:S-DNA-T family DNA segregation ATPase FtsK/SpoIIIE